MRILSRLIVTAALGSAPFINAIAQTVPAKNARRGHDGNGGDMCKRRFEEVRDDIKGWITKGGAKGLRLTEPLTQEKYEQKMNQYLADYLTSVDCVGPGDKDFPVEVMGKPRTCKNFFDDSGHPRVVCDATKFLGTSESDQYVLVHHEYAGLAEIETNRGEDSDFKTVSDQITGFLVDQIVKKLAIKPQSASGLNPIIEYIREQFRNSRVPSMKDILVRSPRSCTSYYAFEGSKLPPESSLHQFRPYDGILYDKYSISGFRSDLAFVLLGNHLVAEGMFPHVVGGSFQAHIKHSIFIRMTQGGTLLVEYAANSTILKRQLNAVGPYSISENSLAVSRYDLCPAGGQ